MDLSEICCEDGSLAVLFCVWWTGRNPPLRSIHLLRQIFVLFPRDATSIRHCVTFIL